MGRLTIEEFRGSRFERLVIIGIVPDKRPTTWIVRCDCGVEKELPYFSWKRMKSCGCWKVDRNALGHNCSTNGGTREYHTWVGMRQRCYDTNAKAYKRYGARGIRVCDSWMQAFENFYADMGDCPEGMSLDRIDNNGNYCPDNCHWATASQQSDNRRTSRWIPAFGMTHTIQGWSKLSGIPHATLTTVLNRGDDLESYLIKRGYRVCPNIDYTLRTPSTGLENNQTAQ